MSDELEDNVELYPAWKQALARFLEAGFVPDEIIPHEWWWKAFGMDMPTEQTPLKVAERAKLQWLTQFTKLKTTLLEQHQIALRNEAGLGYRIVPPRDQARQALKDGLAMMNKAARMMVDWSVHTNTSAMTADERRAHTDNVARIAGLGSMLRRTRKLPSLDEE